MGYSTSFTGHFKLDKQLTLDDYRFLKEFADEDHRSDDSCPSPYCQWVPTEDGKGIEWDGNEKFHEYVKWLQYMISMLASKGYILSGKVAYNGESSGDMGEIVIAKEVAIQKVYNAQGDSIKKLVQKGLGDEENAYWYLEEIAKKLKLS